MPEQIHSEKLTPEQKQKAFEYIQARLQDRPLICPLCGKNDWFIADHLVLPISMTANFSVLIGGGPTYPQIMLISKDCGYTMFINAVIMGIVRVPIPKPQEENPPEAKKGLINSA